VENEEVVSLLCLMTSDVFLKFGKLKILGHPKKLDLGLK
jgi:hypothetical protein